MEEFHATYKYFRVDKSSAVISALPMRTSIDRTILNVQRHDGAWAVELEGEIFGKSADREESKAAAHRRARELQDSGRPCQVRVSGETGYFTS